MRQHFIKIGPYINFLGLQYIQSHKISYLEFGDSDNKNVIICAHGLTRNAHDFDKIAQALSKDFRVIAINYPGRGDSDYFKIKKHYNYQVYIKDSLFFLNELKIKQTTHQITWLGTSMGGIIGMVLASKYPKLFKNLIINDVGPFISSSPLVKIGQYAGKTLLFDDLNSAKQHLKLIYSQFGITAEEDWDYLTQHSFKLNFDGKYKMNYDPDIVYSMKTTSYKPKDVNLWKIWDKIECNLLVVHGAKSEILTESIIKEMKRNKNLDLYVVESAGHAPALIASDQIDYIQTWVNNV